MSEKRLEIACLNQRLKLKPLVQIDCIFIVDRQASSIFCFLLWHTDVYVIYSILVTGILNTKCESFFVCFFFLKSFLEAKRIFLSQKCVLQNGINNWLLLWTAHLNSSFYIQNLMHRQHNDRLQNHKEPNPLF